MSPLERPRSSPRLERRIPGPSHADGLPPEGHLNGACRQVARWMILVEMCVCTEGLVRIKRKTA
ncbi:hypothetical protein DM860_011120 [Cuscuta australis]|uniref:Uncharacterized protein n=1 Tax=Cuscuta australis TaxID=267555 RepID=A0A328D9F6_9ASTE|nr:hypothetical protein DM860_011120 [Cuscuta australis]